MRRSRETGIVVPRASWREISPRKAKSSYRKEKEPRTRTQKRGHFNRGKEGDILKEL
jgi:hypothetical protein